MIGTKSKKATKEEKKQAKKKNRNMAGKWERKN